MHVALTTLGCKVNQYDTATIEDRLRGAGHEIVSFADTADVYIVNSCTVTNQADAESRQLARRAKRVNPTARVIMTGCYAQVNPKAVAKVPEVDYVIGLNRLDDLLRAVTNEVALERISVSNLRKQGETPRVDTSERSRLVAKPALSSRFRKGVTSSVRFASCRRREGRVGVYHLGLYWSNSTV